jgi:hypothetical protein
MLSEEKIMESDHFNLDHFNYPRSQLVGIIEVPLYVLFKMTSLSYGRRSRAVCILYDL